MVRNKEFSPHPEYMNMYMYFKLKGRVKQWFVGYITPVLSLPYTRCTCVCECVRMLSPHV